MDKAILMTCSPHECCSILNLSQSLLIRKKFPTNFRGWVYVYCAKGKPELSAIDCEHYDLLSDKTTILLNGKVVARFYVDNVRYYLDKGTYHYYNGLSHDEMMHIIDNYHGELSPTGNKYFIHISQLQILPEPLPLSHFKTCYVHKYKYIMRRTGAYTFNTYRREYKNHKLKTPPRSYCYIKED